MNDMGMWPLLLTVLNLIVLLALFVWLGRKMTAPQDTLWKLSLEQTLEGLSKTVAQQSFALDETQKQIRLLGNDIEQRQAGQVQSIQTQFAQARAEGQQNQAHFQQQVLGQLTQFSDTLHRTNTLIQEQLREIRTSVEKKLTELQADNASKLEEMRKTVDEKLHATLEQRLGESFKQVSDRLEAVYKGLGEMQTLAAGVGDLKRVLTNVKTRGTWGEVQLQALLEQMLTPSQYGQNVKTVPGSNAIVEFAVRLPGRTDGDAPVWLPIDSKFPKEQYERLMEAFDRADPEAVTLESKALEMAVRNEAKTISDKYLAPPHTTDFGIMFLPTEGLYAEVVKRPGLVDDLQRLHRVTVAGPSTLTTLLNALQLGFKTLALEKRSSEVWTILSAVKTEFGKFGDVLAKTKETLERAAKNIESAETRSRVMQRKLKGMDELPAAQALDLLGLQSDEGSGGDLDE
ncbi:MAG TPA: DNA recombination protein RmuC [Limnobacter sp.]|uniref:DNA recombination protein RmuC n=1 Tax=Limnobacter sp. TaxID=2003368 RepID=UPI002E2ECEC3|nr:DNA recombination protein RmuC [Limnobacter sp.]HEX5484853.1 DNA recombination protein RmuC [Limnobacter sp.]